MRRKTKLCQELLNRHISCSHSELACAFCNLKMNVIDLIKYTDTKNYIHLGFKRLDSTSFG